MLRTSQLVSGASRLRLALALAGAAMVGLASGGAGATTTTSSFSVTMTLTASCTIVSTATLSFGSQGVLTANVDVTSTLQVQCTNTTPYNIGLDKGANGTSVTARLLKGGPSNETIQYSIYRDSARTLNWGNTVGTDTTSATGNGASQSYTIYGRVPPQTTPTPGTYTDTITVTVTY